MRPERVNLLWKGLAMVGGALAATVATRLIGIVWAKVTNSDNPLERAPGTTTRRREIVWVVVSGVTIAFVRLVARRALARVWRAKTGQYPEPLVASSPPGTVGAATS